MERLQHPYMKHVMDVGIVGEAKMVCDGDALNNMERAGKPRTGLLMVMHRKYLGDCLVHHLGLAICLWMESRTHT